MKEKLGKIFKKVLWLELIALVLIGVFFLILYFRFTPTIFDRPKNLSENTETIEVRYVNWACDCADFIETKYHQTIPDYEIKEEDCIFIEPANSSVIAPSDFYNKGYSNKKLLLTGQFYKDKGIPSSYDMKTPGNKPEKAKVFLYTQIKVVSK